VASAMPASAAAAATTTTPTTDAKGTGVGTSLTASPARPLASKAPSLPSLAEVTPPPMRQPPPWPPLVIPAHEMPRNTTLVELTFFNNNIGPRGAATLAELVRTRTGMTKLNIGPNAIGAVGVELLSPVLVDINVAWLKTLRLRGNNLGVDGAIHLRKALATEGATRSLTHLSLASNRLTDRGLELLCPVLTSLSILDLADNQITDATPLAITVKKAAQRAAAAAAAAGVPNFLVDFSKTASTAAASPAGGAIDVSDALAVAGAESDGDDGDGGSDGGGAAVSVGSGGGGSRSALSTALGGTGPLGGTVNRRWSMGTRRRAATASSATSPPTSSTPASSSSLRLLRSPSVTTTTTTTNTITSSSSTAAPPPPPAAAVAGGSNFGATHVDTPQQAAARRTALALLPQWKTLYLDHNPLQDAGVALLCTALRRSAPLPLETLDLRRTGIASQGATMKALVALVQPDAYAHGGGLQSLSLAGNAIGNAALLEVATALEKNTRLRSLDVRQTGLSSGGTLAFASAISAGHAAQMIDIRIDSNPISLDVRAGLSSVLQRARIRRVGAYRAIVGARILWTLAPLRRGGRLVVDRVLCSLLGRAYAASISIAERDRVLTFADTRTFFGTASDAHLYYLAALFSGPPPLERSRRRGTAPPATGKQ